MKQIKNGRIVKHTLPVNGFLSDGRAVSNYNRLPKATLEAEGWVDEVEVKPAITKDQMLGSVKFEVVDKQVIKTYEVLEKPIPVEPEPDPIDQIKQRLEVLESKALEEPVIKG